MSGELAGKRVLIIVENLPLPFDRRVWQEAKTLKAAGAEVAVICPTGKGFEQRYEVIEGVELFRHPQSILSFPLRNQAILCLAALAVVLLLRSPVAGAAKAESAL